MIGLEYKETIGITDSSDAFQFVDKSHIILGFPSLDDYQCVENKERWKYIVNEKWIAMNHQYHITYLQYLFQWTIEEQEKDEALPPNSRRSIKRPTIFPHFKVKPHLHFLI